MTEKTIKLKIHRVLDGPFSSFDVYDDEDYDGDFWFCNCLIETPDKELSEDELRFDDLDDFYEIKNHLDKHIEPFEQEMMWVELE